MPAQAGIQSTPMDAVVTGSSACADDDGAERSRAALYKCIRDEVTRLCSENRLRPILIVDDDPTLCETLSQQLAVDGARE